LIARPGLYRQLNDLQNRHRQRSEEFAADAAAIPGALEPAIGATGGDSEDAA
jgi:hypothetical protein